MNAEKNITITEDDMVVIAKGTKKEVVDLLMEKIEVAEEVNPDEKTQPEVSDRNLIIAELQFAYRKTRSIHIRRILRQFNEF